MQIIKLRENAIIPQYQTDGSAGFDLHACLDQSHLMSPGETFVVPTGLKIWIGVDGFVGKIYPRSSWATKKGLVLANGTGIIDSDYQGEWMIALKNLSGHSHRIKNGDRIAQCIIETYVKPSFREVSCFHDVTARGEGGFGSTG